MSWDNVTGVSTAYIWTDNPDMTQAYLFANGNHQVKVTVGVSFNLQGEGPTEDEVKAAISLLNYNTSAEISHLKPVGQGEYLSVYLPNMPEQPKAMADSSGKIYQYEFDYYLSSDSDINPNFLSEQVAVLISYTNADGKSEYSTASGSSWQSYVAVAVYSPKKYGMINSTSTPIVLKLKDDKPDSRVVANVDYVKDAKISSTKVYSLRIDDSYFRIVTLNASDTVATNNGFYRDGSKNGGVQSGYQPYNIHESYLIADNKVNQGRKSYTSTFYIVPGENEAYWFSTQVNIHQEPNEIIFVSFSGSASSSTGTFTNDHSSADFTVYDQFGNQLNITVTASNDDLSVSSVE